MLQVACCMFVDVCCMLYVECCTLYVVRCMLYVVSRNLLRFVSKSVCVLDPICCSSGVLLVAHVVAELRSW